VLVVVLVAVLVAVLVVVLVVVLRESLTREAHTRASRGDVHMSVMACI